MNQHHQPTIAQLAAEYGMEPYAVQAALDTDTAQDAPLDEATVTEYREVLDILAQQAADRA